ncbi:MAG: methyltransferase domain-containing protein [Verrucomicrobiae bacterium]|nr:methyltransferase domain-containing protein [Verrucomicrobiae bacterium]
MESRSGKPRLPRATELAHRFVTECLGPGDRAIDATAGNGHDTLFLAELVGPEGKVVAFDVQPEAIEATRARLEAGGVADRVRLVRECHSRLADSIEGEWNAVMFNLGYLPGGDKATITRPETTLAAMEAALKVLAPRGRMMVVVYPGHPGGEVEAEMVERWAAELDQARFSVASYGFLNQTNSPPRLVVIEKR